MYHFELVNFDKQVAQVISSPFLMMAWICLFSCLLKLASKSVCIVKVSLLELVSVVGDQRTEYRMITSLGKVRADICSCAQY